MRIGPFRFRAPRAPVPDGGVPMPGYAEAQVVACYGIEVEASAGGYECAGHGEAEQRTTHHSYDVTEPPCDNWPWSP